MPLSPSNRVQLALLRDIYEVSHLCGTRTYIWAGLVRDIVSGHFLRDHGDVDGFTLNLWQLRDDLETLYRQRGYAVSYLNNVQFMCIERDGVHATFNRLEVDGETAPWRHIGDQGTVYFPRQWLSDMPLQFYDTPVLISGIEFEYAIKTHPQLLSPTWHGRDKDIEAIAWLSERLAERQIAPEDVLRHIWSYNPFWAKRGYPEYALPTVAWPLEPRPLEQRPLEQRPLEPQQ